MLYKLALLFVATASAVPVYLHPTELRGRGISCPRNAHVDRAGECACDDGFSMTRAGICD